MLSRLQFRVLTLLSALVALLMAVNIYLFASNREMQNDVNQRALFIQQTGPLEALSREIAVALAQLGTRSRDEQIRALLASLGITVTVNSTPPPAGSSANEASRRDGGK